MGQKELLKKGKKKANEKLVVEQAEEIKGLEKEIKMLDGLVALHTEDLKEVEELWRRETKKRAEGLKKIKEQKKEIKLWKDKAEKAEEALKDSEDWEEQIKKDTLIRNLELRGMVMAEIEDNKKLRSKLKTKDQRIKTLSGRNVKFKREIKRLKKRNFWKRLLNK